MLQYPSGLKQIALVLAPFCFLAGCSGGDPSGSVTGKVTLQGEPVDGCVICFRSDDLKVAASSPVDNGSFSLETSEGSSSLPAGTYRVFFVLDDADRPAVTAEDRTKGISPPPAVYPTWLTPKLRGPLDTPLRKEVSVGKNSISIEIPEQ